MSILSKKITTVKNSKSFYFSASDFKAAAQPSKKIRSATFEVIDPPKQYANVNEVVEYYTTNQLDGFLGRPWIWRERLFHSLVWPISLGTFILEFLKGIK